MPPPLRACYAPDLLTEVLSGRRRVVALDTETTGFGRGAAPTNYPIQIALAVVEGQEEPVRLVYDRVIRGAEQLSSWTAANVALNMERIRSSDADLPRALSEIDLLLREDDIIVAHNVAYDLAAVLRPSASRAGVGLGRLGTLPWLCTVRSPLGVSGARRPKLEMLCSMLGVSFRAADAHDAAYDARALAGCVARAQALYGPGR